MRSSMLVLLLLLLLLVSVQAVLTTGVHPIPQSPLQHPAPGSTPAATVPTVDPKLFSKHRHRSPRVLFSDQPPDAEPPALRGGGQGGRTRRRAAEVPQHRGVYSVCDSVSVWVGDKTKATDIKGNEVTVLPNVKINNANKKQYFFETTCSSGRATGSGCLGIDGRHWNSYCTNSHTFVRALTSFENLVAWRHIRINVACVCVLSRKSWRQ
ncbi:nerve growth factor [Alosa sapidissima]|uniref:nerve growth factor n=1 Tax=Alosa sapidissima TaxID=34773 RepID=UPI001C0A1BB2|nr:nerve growth factor [Alosa sapidissima]XP_041945590.1 nerve growth factor [Alosa sapidissima]